MPSMANITVKAANGTTDVIYTALAPSSGDGVAAVWRNDALGTASAFKTQFSVWSKFNGPKTVRRISGEFIYPQTATDSTTGITSVVNRVPVTFSFGLPQAVPQTIIDEVAHQLGNLLTSTLIRDVVKTGYAPS